jgi:hypothetical protein
MVHLRIIGIQRSFIAADVIGGCTANMEALVIALLFEWKYVYHCDRTSERIILLFRRYYLYCQWVNIHQLDTPSGH